ncbi:pyridoxal phosphate-dependent aminotransferase family protein [Hydrogenophaga sp. PAMC20947]|uniref:pyridoxal phosphate-dependent aminotransferase family protein n=1 Tax=Hydrogenophaga sp. PAMC20947 TaxID=2565558 RepID=UPI00109E2774|nr:pyridoxal phosphate-dependent aminotransferase family protein [Hydrogenophaga sp. PAMC20947]QCB46893.1 pyridoxal phosphate-dependent aminotransferase family protein [Hydrogenophaga sp. PAMC20947]
MLDFTSSLYLGLHHGSTTLDPWDSLSLGRPAALDEAPEARVAAHELARLVGCADGTLLPSTFHLFWDLLGVLSREQIEIFMDASTYPIARWGAEHWATKGVPLHTFARHDPKSLERLMARRHGCRPVVLCDGMSPGSNSQPPLAAYAGLANSQGGWLVIDDTQALGVYGQRPSAGAPYGVGGGGSLLQQGLAGHHMVVGASLAKGFGVPVALLAGSAVLLRRFLRNSASREHMSPPSLPVVLAARQALVVNAHHGEHLRLRLWRAVRRLRSGLAALGIATRGGDFPVQTLITPPGAVVPLLHTLLLHAGVRTVLHRDSGGGSGAQLSFLLRADHSAAHIDQAVMRLAHAWNTALEPA